MDLKGFLAGDAPVVEGRGFGGIAEQPPAKPLIAAVEGYALAGGSSWPWPATWSWPARTAKFGLPEVRRGLVAGAGGLLRLPRRIPYHLAMEIALTGEHYPAAAAGRGRPGQPGSCRQGQALAGARELARRVALGAPLALAATKRVDRRVRRLGQRRGVRPPGGDHQPGLRLGGREGRRAGVRGKAAAGLARRVSAGANPGRKPPNLLGSALRK